MQYPVQPTENPYDLFREWFADAQESEPRDPEAICVATVDKSGRPSARMVLMKEWDQRGFVFYTNFESRKGEALHDNPDKVAFCMHWKSLNRQVRVEGRVEQVSAAEADAYYQSRPRGSRVGAWASDQSRPLDSRDTLLSRVEDAEKRFADAGENIPRPAHWSGFRIIPDHIEFWAEQPFRLHDRVLYQQQADGSWRWHRLFP